MNYLNQINDNDTRYAEALVHENIKNCSWSIKKTISFSFQLIFLLGILALEFHFLHFIFDYIKSEDQEGLSPTLMSFTAGVMVLAFHILAFQDKNNIAVRFVNTATKFLLPFYLLGLGLILAGIIAYGGGLFSLFDGDIIFTPDMLAEPDNNWVETFITNFNNPAAVLAFSIGIGGLAITNLFCANYLIHNLKEIIDSQSENHERARRLKAILDRFYNTREKIRELTSDLADLEPLDNQAIAEDCGGLVLGTIQEALSAPKTFEVNNLDFPRATTPYEFPSKPLEGKQLKSRIAAIDAIDLEHVMTAMLTQPKTKVS